MKAFFFLLLLAPYAAAQAPLLAPDAYTLKGSFGAMGPGEWCASIEKPDFQFPRFSSCVSNIADGALITEPFRAPPVLRLWVAGFTHQPGARIYLKDVDQLRTFDLRSPSEPGLTWSLFLWTLPEEWRGANVQLIAEDRTHNVGTRLSVSLPESAPLKTDFYVEEAPSLSFPLQLTLAIYRMVSLYYLALLALLPGLAIAAWLTRFRQLETWQLLASVLLGSGIVAYASFWPYLWSPIAGRAVAIAIPLLSVAALGFLLRRGTSVLPAGVLREAMLCFGLVTLVASLNTASGFLFPSEAQPGEAAQVRYLSHQLPPDNILPEIVAAHIYSGESVANITAFLVGVHSSDRPPLQSSFFLANYPYWQLLSKELSGYLLAIWLQSTWVAGIWILLRRFGFGYRSIVPVVVLGTLSSFCVVHSFYVWPKLLSATYCLIAIACFPAPGTPWSLRNGIIAALATCLSLLSHPDCLFTFLALGILVVVQRSIPRLTILAAGAAIAGVLMLPWRWYQLYYDPTTDTLSKLHLSGIVDPKLSTFQSVVQAYTHLSWHSWVSAKAYNLAAIAGHPFALWNENTFMSLVFAVGVLWAGLFARKTKLPVADRFLGIALVSTVIWVLVMFQPGATIVHQGSFATVLLLFAGLTLYVTEFRPKWILPIVFIQANFFAIAILHTAIPADPDAGMFTLLVAALCALAYCLRLSFRSPDPLNIV